MLPATKISFTSLCKVILMFYVEKKTVQASMKLLIGDVNSHELTYESSKHHMLMLLTNTVLHFS